MAISLLKERRTYAARDAVAVSVVIPCLNEAESIAGLWAYAKTYGKEVSRLPGSPVADGALRIGRAVTGVYNKVMNEA